MIPKKRFAFAKKNDTTISLRFHQNVSPAVFFRYQKANRFKFFYVSGVDFGVDVWRQIKVHGYSICCCSGRGIAL